MPDGTIQYGKKLISAKDSGASGVHLSFEDGTEVHADLVVGADGIRSVRQISFLRSENVCLHIVAGCAENAISRSQDSLHRFVWNALGFGYQMTRDSYAGNTVWRTLVPRATLAHIPDISNGTSWWYVKGGHVFLSGVDDPSEIEAGGEDLFELSVRSYHEPDVPGRTVSWGIPATNERVQARFVVCFKS